MLSEPWFDSKTDSKSSVDPSPFPEDVKLTKDATQAAQLLSIDLPDHVIIGRGRFVSLKDQGVL